MTITCPIPMRPVRSACRMVATPQTATDASTAQERYASVMPAARMTTMGISITAAMLSTASCRPTPRASRRGGVSSGW
ncbi:MAG: hypothetical protein J4G12_09105 [Gemmatimonadetes bacterium]|nr:hypothetical protein [Gemmatimonadota bacterium]